MTNVIPFWRQADVRSSTPHPNTQHLDADLTGTLVGRAAHDVCLRLQLSGDAGLAIASAPIWCRERIVESGFPVGPAVILFTGRDLDGSPAFATVATAAWSPTVLRLSATPAYAFAESIHLLTWPGALQPRSRRAMSAEIGRRIAVQGGARRLGRLATNRPRTRNEVSAVASAALLLVAAIHPAIVDGSRT